MPTILELYNSNSAPPTVLAAKAMGTTANNGRGVNFFDGGPGGGKFNPLTPPTRTDSWQDEFKELAQDTKVVPAATNDKSYPLSRWKPEALKIGFEGLGPSSLPTGYFTNVRFNTFKGVRTTGDGKLHNYAPLSGKQYAGSTTESGLNAAANGRVKAGATSTGVSGIRG